MLTTHTGSLARPKDVADLLIAKERGEQVNADVFAERISQAVVDIVSRQAGVSLDVVSDGEMSKPGFNNYVKDRLNGFEGEESPMPNREFEDFPDFSLATARQMNTGSRTAADASSQTAGGVSLRRAPSCTGPISVKTLEYVHRDIANLRSALKNVTAADAFIPAASPGSVALIMANQYYPTYEAYLYALADALAPEYRAILEGGLLLQVDCPDLGMCGHRQFVDASREEFRRAMQLHVEALHHALRTPNRTLARRLPRG